MSHSLPSAPVFVPDALETTSALARTTHLGIGAHQDDLEFMAYHGIIACRHDPLKWFTGVTCTDGSGSARTGTYANMSNEELMALRHREQEEAAIVGRFGAMMQLGYPSSVVKEPGSPALAKDLLAILEATRPEIVYTHNPADKHDTHIGVFTATIAAIRSLPAADRPKKVYGCEGWRGLDWMQDDEKVLLDVSGAENLASAINGVFDSQISGGKRYDLAVLGRRRSNATFFNSHAADQADMITLALDLTPLAQDDTLDIVDYVTGYIDRFRNDVQTRLRKHLG